MFHEVASQNCNYILQTSSKNSKEFREFNFYILYLVPRILFLVFLEKRRTGIFENWASTWEVQFHGANYSQVFQKRATLKPVENHSKYFTALLPHIILEFKKFFRTATLSDTCRQLFHVLYQSRLFLIGGLEFLPIASLLSFISLFP